MDCALQEEMDPYEKLLSPCRNTRRSARLSQAKSVEKESEAEQESGDKTAEKKGTVWLCVEASG